MLLVFDFIFLVVWFDVIFVHLNLNRWEGGPMKVPWTFNTGAETVYIQQGKVKVTVEGHDESFELEAGNLAVFPKDMSITWEVIEPLKKHYNVEE